MVVAVAVLGDQGTLPWKRNGLGERTGGLVFFLAPEQERFEQLIRTWDLRVE